MRKNKSLRATILLLIVSFLLATSIAPITYAESVLDSGIETYGTPDSTPPVLHSVGVDKMEVNAGETLTVFADITDDVSGLDFANARFINKANNKDYTINMHVNPESKRVEGKIKISDLEPGGTFVLYTLCAWDNAGNYLFYYSDDNSSEHDKVFLPNECHFIVLNDSQTDSNPPTINDIAVDKESVDAGDLIKISVDLTDDISGPNYVNLSFKNSENNRIIEKTAHYNEDTGLFEAIINISQYEQTGQFYLKQAMVADNEWNTIFYYSKLEDVNNQSIKRLPREVIFKVNNDSVFDIEGPILKKISIDKTIIEAPGYIAISGEVIDELSGIYLMSLNFVNENKKRLDINISNREFNGNNFSLNYEISQYEASSTYHLSSLWLRDKIGNMRHYYSKYDQYIPTFAEILPTEISFRVINADDLFATNTNNPNLTDDIKNQPEGSDILIDYKNNPHLSKDIFEAIKGQDKNIVLEDGGIQWIFNGKDIESSKDIDLSVTQNPISDPNAGQDKIQSIVKDTPAIVLTFPNNGKLPGKATIRIKADYEFYEYMGKENLCIYYYDAANDKMVEVAKNLIVKSDGYIEFEITHNSQFVITKGKIDTSNGEGSNDTITPKPEYRPNVMQPVTNMGKGSRTSSRSEKDRSVSTPILKPRLPIGAEETNTSEVLEGAVDEMAKSKPIPNTGKFV